MAVDFYLKIDGIPGESQDSKHKDEIDLDSWSWGITQSGTTHRGGGSGGGKCDVQDLTFVKEVCKASSALYKHVSLGSHIGSMKLTCRLAGGDSQVEYLVLDLTDCIITSIQTGGNSGGDKTSETISVNFGKYKMTYTPQNADGSAGAAAEFGYDIAGAETT